MMTNITTINMKNWRNNKHSSCSISSDLLSDRLARDKYLSEDS